MRNLRNVYFTRSAISKVGTWAFVRITPLRPEATSPQGEAETRSPWLGVRNS